jgi:glycosyltransferase involved in cell wall biosynthesis
VGREVAIADLDSFPRALRQLVADQESRRALGKRAREHARDHNDWQALADRYREVLDELLMQRPVRVLACTFRFTDPPLGGAERYLLELLEQLPKQRFVTDVATFNVHGISTYGHFSARYEHGSQAHPSFVQQLHAFDVDHGPEADIMSRCRRIYSSWQKEETAQARQLAGRFCEVTLLGGWYFPEHRDGKVGRWTGEWAEIYCPEAFS